MALIDRLKFWSTDSREQQQEEEEDTEELREETIKVPQERNTIIVEYHDGETIRMECDEYSITDRRIKLHDYDYESASFYRYDIPEFSNENFRGIMLNDAKTYNIEKEEFVLIADVERKYINGEKKYIENTIDVRVAEDQ